MEGLVKEYANFLNDDKKPASERFWELEKRIKEDKRHPGVVVEPVSYTHLGETPKQIFKGKVVKGMNEKFLEVGDVMQILGISRSAAYKLMRQINSELEKKGYIVIRGKVSRKYFEERIYGMSDAG